METSAANQGNEDCAASAGLINRHFAEQFIRENYGIEGVATQLAGEYDLNFAIHANGRNFLLKIARAHAEREELEFQNQVLARVADRLDPGQRVVAARSGELMVPFPSAEGIRWARVLTFLDGRVMASVAPHTPELLRSLGGAVAAVDKALEGLAHPLAQRDFKWNPAQSDGMLAKLDSIENIDRRTIAARHLEYFRDVLKPRLRELPAGIVHGDANDHNVVVGGMGYESRVVGLIDFGDAMHSPLVCGLAIALAYAMLGKADPLAAAAQVVGGYHEIRPLTEQELEPLYPLALTRLAVSVTNSAAEKLLRPDDPYIVVSEAPAWALLENLEAVHPRFAHYVFRHACGLEPAPNLLRLVKWLKNNEALIGSVIERGLCDEPLKVFDLSVGSLELGYQGIDPEVMGVGRYNEARIRDNNDNFSTPGEHGKAERTIHLGMDFFVPAGSSVMAPLAGVVHSVEPAPAREEKGSCIILEHTVDDGEPLKFFTLYAGLDDSSLEKVRVGQPIESMQIFGRVGDARENGGWRPHLHFQAITDLLELDAKFPSFASPADAAVWRSLSPDPNFVVRIPSSHFPGSHLEKSEILAKRRVSIGRNLAISYREPLNITRGRGQYLFDDNAQAYLDCYNNVPHVGHNHPHVVRAAQRQMEVLNTNTRYLHENLVRYAERLTAKLPEPLTVCYFVSSGSEATELALRLAQAHTKQRDLIVSDHAYHGHTSTLIDISPYKAEGPGGWGLPDWVHKLPVPDDYRGRFPRGQKNVGECFAADVDAVVERIHMAGRGLRGFIIESIPSVGGQIVLPEGYLQGVYRRVRSVGGLCIADEVQTGFGRIGSHFWGFQHQGVVPDIVAMGKPMGNGFPLGAVVTTQEIAASFDNGMEFFATFGGSPVACAVGMAVLDVIEAENLQDHALKLGEYLMEGLRSLQQNHIVIGDVRGLGLFNGIEFVQDRATKTPAPQQASYVVNRLRDFRILTGTDGPHHNVIKLRGPMVLTKSDVDTFLTILDIVLREDAAKA